MYDNIFGDTMEDIRIITKIVRNMRLFKNKNDFPLGDNALEVLRFVIKHPGVNGKEIAKHLEVDKALITRLCTKLINEGYIESKSGDDLRQKCFYPMKKALEIKEISQNDEKLFYEYCLKDLTEAEYQAMMVGLEKMYAISKKERKENFLGVLNEKKRKSN